MSIIMCKCFKKIIERVKCPKEYSGEYLKELSFYEETKQNPSWYSLLIPIVALVIIAVLLFLLLNCSAQSACNCCKDTKKTETSIAAQLDINCDNFLRIICSDTTTLKKEIELSSEHIIVKPQNYPGWPLIIFRIVIAIIISIALLLILKYLVPYWTRIAELNDKQKERLIKLAEDRLEYERLPRKTKIDILERQARANIDEKARDGENKRNIDKMKQEYQSHLADVALDITKAYDQNKDANSINQIIQNLK